VRKSFSQLAWFVGAVGVVLGLVNILTPSASVGNTFYFIAATQLAMCVVIGFFAHRPDPRTWLVILGVSLFTVAGQILADNSLPSETLRIVSESFFLAVQILLASALLLVTLRRNGTAILNSLGDALVVALGVWLLIWIGLLQPSLNIAGEPTVISVLRGITLATSTIVLFLLVSLLFSEANRTPSIWLLFGAISLSLLGDFLFALDKSGHASVSDRFLNAPYVISLFLASATFLHPSVRSLTHRSTTRQRQPLLGRLVLTTTALVVPLIAIALFDPRNQVDRVIRAISLFVLAASVTARVIQAVRTNARTQAVLVKTAQTDALTLLPNRSLMLKHIEEAVDNAWRTGRVPAVHFIDVDRFKNINDSLGHSAGDDVLVAVAQRLTNAVPATAIVGRISGDEFVVLEPDSVSDIEAMKTAERLLECFREPLALRQGDVFVSASIGVACSIAADSPSPEELLRHADAAMYRAKDAGRNCIALFDASMLERATQRLTLETALYRALERQELTLVYQPIIDLHLGDVLGFEALMRWEREDGSTSSPAQFIPIAEETGIIVPIGAWALIEALTHLRSWIDAGICPETASMSVNVSPRQLHDPQFVSVVSEALSRARVQPQQLWLEMTESIMITEPEQALAALRRLNTLGVRIAIDDFGTGYSSLSLLQSFPIQRLKIDRSFISGIADDVSARSLVKTILAMSDALGLDTVAEGVETSRQLEALIDLHCAKAQGYLISHPVAPEQMRNTVISLEKFSQWPKYSD
jgi:diguanylate cyclase (GGDEF)-like protein